MATSEEPGSRARLIRQMTRNSSRRNNSTTSSITSHGSVGSVADSEFDPENEALMSTRQFDNPPESKFSRSKQYARPEPAFRIDKQALKQIIPESSDDGSSQDDSIEIGRGGKKTRRTMEDSRNDDSIQSADAVIGNYRVMYTPPLSASKTASKRRSSHDLRKDAQLRLASMVSNRENIDPIGKASKPRSSHDRGEKQDRRTLAEMHAKATEVYDGSLMADERPPTVTFTTKNTRFGSGSHNPTKASQEPLKGRQASRTHATDNVMADDNQSYMLPDLPNLSELVSGIYEDGTPVFSRTGTTKSRFGPAKKSRTSSRPQGHLQIDAVPIPDDEKAIFVSLKLLQEKVAGLEYAKAEAEKRLEEVEQTNAVLRSEKQEAKRYRRSDSALGTSSEEDGLGSHSQRNKLENANTALRTNLASANRKITVHEMTIRNLNNERDAATAQLGVAFLSSQELLKENELLGAENESLKSQLAQVSSFLTQGGRAPAAAHQPASKADPRQNLRTRLAETHQAHPAYPNDIAARTTSPQKERRDKATSQVKHQISNISQHHHDDDALFDLDLSRPVTSKTANGHQTTAVSDLRPSLPEPSFRIREDHPEQDLRHENYARETTAKDADQTYLSVIDPGYISRLRKTIEKERMARKAGAKTNGREQTREMDSHTSARARSAPLPEVLGPRKSSLKKSTKTSAQTQMKVKDATLTSRSQPYQEEDDEDLSENEQISRPISRFQQKISEPTMTGVSAVSNTSRRRHRPAFADENMTSAFILPDITIAQPQKTAENVSQTVQEVLHTTAPHDGSNCVVCKRVVQEANNRNIVGGATEANGLPKETVSIPRPVPVTERVPAATEANPDPTIRPSQSPSLALAIAIKTSEDELSHLKAELTSQQSLYSKTDPSLSRRERKQVGEKVDRLLKACEQKSDLIYALYDVLEGQKQSGQEMTQEEVEVTLMNLKDVVEMGQNGTRASRNGVFSDSESGSDVDEQDLPVDEEWNGLPESTHTKTMTKEFPWVG